MNRQREQRLQAIYDAFDARNYKGAIKLSNAAIQKYPEQPVFKSLKAVALDRIGKTEEALQLVDEVLSLAPADDHVLHMLLLVLKPAKRAGDLQKAYETACSRDPNNVELLQGLFGCHVRSFNFQSQQQVAIKLNKLHPNELYQWWVITTLALQCHEVAAAVPVTASTSASSDSTAGGAAAAAPAGGMGADKLLQLAEAMAARLLSKHMGCCPPSWESVVMYLGLLQAQGKHDAALAALRGNLAKAFSLAAERREAEAALLLAKGDLLAAAALYEAALRDQPDDFALLLLYLDCLLPGTACTLPAISSTAVAQMLTGVEASTAPGYLLGGVSGLMAAMTTDDSTGPSVQDHLEKAAAFIASLPATAPVDEAASHNSSDQGGDDLAASSSSSATKAAPLLRGPALAVVELAKRRLQLGVATQQDLAEAVLQYHDKLGHVVSCAMDVSTYLPWLTGAVRTALGEQLARRAAAAASEYQQQQQQQEQGSSSNKELLRLLRRQMAARQTQADLGGPCFDTAAAAQQHAQHLLQLYASYLPLYEGLDERERGPADELLWLAAAALMQAAAFEQQALPANSSSSSSDGLGYMLQALLVLEAAAMGRPYCAPVRLGLTGLHGLLGNPKAAATHFFMLDVKHIQYDTLSSHHLLPVLLGLCVAEGCEEVLGATLRLFDDHISGDAGESLMQAFERGSHTKVLEFVCFKERLQRSHSFVLAQAEQAILSTGTAAGTSAKAALTAAHAAVAKLPLALLDSPHWQRMRFNDDLTTRVPWLPPIAGPRHMHLLLWWEQHHHHQQQGLNSSNESSSTGSEKDEHWWKQVSAAEADTQPAVRYRAALQAAAKQRWLLPHMLAAALQAPGPQRSSADAASQLQQLLQRYAASVASDEAALQRELQQCFGEQQGQLGSKAAVSRQLQLLDAALFLLARPVQMLLAAAETDAAADGSIEAVCTSITRCASLVASGLQQLQLRVSEQLQPAKAYLSSVLPGHVLSAAVLLVSESCTWITTCLEAWSDSIKQVRARKRSKTPSAGAGLLQQTVVQAALLDLQAVQNALERCLQAISSNCTNLLEVKQETMEAHVLAQYDPSSNPDVLVLVGWEQRISVPHLIIDVLESQRQVSQQVMGTADKLGKRAHHVSW